MATQYIRYPQPSGSGSGMAIGGTITGGTAGSVLFVGAGGTLAQDPTDFFYNSTTNALTITGQFAASNFSGSSSGTNTGDVTLAAVGAAPNANAATLTGQVLNLQPASASFPGVVTTGTQTFLGAKTFQTSATSPSLILLASTSGTLTHTTAAITSTYTVIWPNAQGASSTFLQNDGAGNLSWSIPTDTGITQLTGDVTAGPGSGSQVATISANAVTNTKLAQMPAHTFKGNNTGSTANALDLTQTQLTAELNQFTTTLQGVVSASGGGTTNFLRADNTWAIPTGTGANTALSNLITTSINQNLVANSDAVRTLGTSAIRWANLFTSTIEVVSSSEIGLRLLDSATTPSGASTASITGFDVAGTSPSASLFSNNNAQINATATGTIRIESGNKTAGTGNSGDISLQTGTSSGGTRGVISLNGASINANTSQIHNVVNPTSAQDAATKSYVDSAASTLTIGTYDSQVASANGLVIATNQLFAQSASATVPGMVNTGTQTFAGAKTFTGAISASNLSGTNTGDQTITLTGDVTGSGTGSFATTLATVNGNVGTFGSSTSIPTITVNAKGLITAASGNAVIAPAGTLSGTTLNATVVSSSLTSVGTITTGTWNGTTIAIANGGTGQTTANAGFNALSPMTTAGDLIYGGASGAGTRLPIGTAGQVLTVVTGNPAWVTNSSTITNWTNYTPTVTGLGTVSLIYSQYRMVGQNVEVRIGLTSGTVTASAITFELPNSLVGNIANDTVCNGNAGTTYNGANISGLIPIMLVANTSVFQVGYNNTRSIETAILGNTISNGDRFYINAEVPV